jgi:hypothetical protein
MYQIHILVRDYAKKIRKNLVLSTFFCFETKTGYTLGAGQAYQIEICTLQ